MTGVQTCALPILLLLDKKVDAIAEICKGYKYKNTGAISIFNKEGKTIYDRDKSVVESRFNPIEASKTDSRFKSIADLFIKALSSDSGRGEYAFEGIEKIAFYEKIPGTDWTIVSYLNKTEAFSQIYTRPGSQCPWPGREPLRPDTH